MSHGATETYRGVVSQLGDEIIHPTGSPPSHRPSSLATCSPRFLLRRVTKGDKQAAKRKVVACISQPSESAVHASFENAPKAGRGNSPPRTHVGPLSALGNMAKGKGDRKGGGAAEEEQEQKLQAILLADSFNTNFRPISSDMPKVLAPVV